MTEPRSYTTVTGEQMPLPGSYVDLEATRPSKVDELRAELARLEVEWAETAEQLVTLQRRRKAIAERRRSLRRAVAHIEALNPFTPQEKH